MSAVEKFPVLLNEAEEESSAVPPCFSSEGINVRIIRDRGTGVDPICLLVVRGSQRLTKRPFCSTSISAIAIYTSLP